jgi:hypothetical protein
LERGPRTEDAGADDSYIESFVGGHSGELYLDWRLLQA